LPQKRFKSSDIASNLHPRLLKKIDFNTSVGNSTFIMGLEETAWGKMLVLVMGSFHVFIKQIILTCILQVKVHMFPEIFIFIFSV